LKSSRIKLIIILKKYSISKFIKKQACRMRKFWLLFVLSNLLLSIFFIDTWKTNGATSASALPIICFLENGSIQIDKYEHLASDKAFVNNHYYSDKPPLGSLITFPFVAIAKQLHLIQAKHNSFYAKGVST